MFCQLSKRALFFLPSPAKFCGGFVHDYDQLSFSTYKRMRVSRAVLSCQVFSCHPPSPPFSLSLLLQVTCRITRRFVLSGRMRRKIRCSPIRQLSTRETLINLIVIFAGVPCQSTFYTLFGRHVTSPNTTSRGNHETTERAMSGQSSA